MMMKIYPLFTVVFLWFSANVFAQELVPQHPTTFLNKMEDVAMQPDGTGLAIGSGILLGTTDFGTNWTILNPSLQSARRVEAIPGNTQSFLLTSNGNIQVTTDGGTSWTMANLPEQPQGGPVRMHALPSANVFYAGSENSIYKSVNGGLDWTLITPNVIDVDWNSMSFPTETLGWMSTDEGDIYRTQDGGATWTPQDINSFTDPVIIEFLDTQIGYATVYRDLYKTVNGGATWTLQLANAFGSHLAQIGIINEDQLVFSQGALVVYASNDGGQTVERFTALPYGYNYEYLTTLPDGRVWLSCSYGSVAYSADGGFSYTDQLPAVKNFLNDLDFLNASIGWAVGRGGMLRTNNGGEEWVAVNTPIDPVELEPSNVSFTKALSYTEAVIGTDRELLHTSNGGTSWQVLLTPEGADEQFRQFAASGSHIWALSGEPKVYHSTDNGANWSDSELSAVFFSPYFMTFPTINTGYIGGSSGLLLKTTDSGLSWDTVPSFTEERLKSAFFLNENEGWIIPDTYADYVFHTTDGGDSWEEVTHYGASYWNKFYAASSQELYIFGGTATSGIAAHSADGGATWELLFNSYVAAYQDVARAEMTNGFRFWVCGAAGWIARAEFLDTGTETITRFPLQLYPNPTKGEFTLTIPSGWEGKADLFVHNAQGQLLYQGTAQSRLDLSESPPGLYFVRLQTKDQAYLGKVLLE